MCKSGFELAAGLLVPMVPGPLPVPYFALTWLSSEPPRLPWEAQPAANRPARATNAINLFIMNLD
jgi:hypothetical protein